MGMNKCIAVRKNDPVETYFSMTTMPLDGMNFGVRMGRRQGQND
jgi:hypothetical protein